MKQLTINFKTDEDLAWAMGKIQEQIKKGNGNQLAGASASILLCALSRADCCFSNNMTEQEARNIRLGILNF